MSGSVSISFPVFPRYSRKAASKRLGKFENDVFIWVLEEDIKLVELERRKSLVVYAGTSVRWVKGFKLQRVVHVHTTCSPRPRYLCCVGLSLTISAADIAVGKRRPGPGQLCEVFVSTMTLQRMDSLLYLS